MLIQKSEFHWWSGTENTYKWFYKSKVWREKEKKVWGINERKWISRTSMGSKPSGKKKNKAVGARELLLSYLSTQNKMLNKIVVSLERKPNLIHNPPSFEIHLNERVSRPWHSLDVRERALDRNNTIYGDLNLREP